MFPLVFSNIHRMWLCQSWFLLNVAKHASGHCKESHINTCQRDEWPCTWVTDCTIHKEPWVIFVRPYLLLSSHSIVFKPLPHYLHTQWSTTWFRACFSVCISVSLACWVIAEQTIYLFFWLKHFKKRQTWKILSELIKY